MIIVLSVLAVPAALALKDVGGFTGMRAALAGEPGLLSLTNPKTFRFWVVILLCIKAPLTALALPHLVSVCAAGRTEWEGRLGFAGGNMLKRICTIGWCILGLCWLVHLRKTGAAIEADAAFGDSIRALLPPVLQGLMLACVMAAAMSSGDAFQVTVAGLFSQNIYRVHIRPKADDRELLRVTKITGIVIVLLSLLVAVLVGSIVKAILAYFSILALVGISTAMGIVWRRMNQVGMFASTIAAGGTFVVTRFVSGFPPEAAHGLPMLAGVIGGVVGSLLTRPPAAERVDPIFRAMHVPVGEEEKLDLPLDEAVPPSMRWTTAGGLFLVRPSRQSWLGFLAILGICVACVVTMWLILRG
jgi:Na+/proline symporter